MEGSGRKLGWIAIGLGVLALVVALSGRSHTQPVRIVQQAPFGSGGQMAPGGDQQAPWGASPRGGDMQGPSMGVGPRGGWNLQAPDLPRMPNPPRFSGGSRMGFGRFFFLPFMLIGGLVRSILFLLLIFLAVRFFRRRNGAGAQSGQRPAGPEQPPFTGDTQNL